MFFCNKRMFFSCSNIWTYEPGQRWWYWNSTVTAPAFITNLFPNTTNTFQMFWPTIEFSKMIFFTGWMLCCDHSCEDRIWNRAPHIKRQSKYFVIVMVTVVWIFIWINLACAHVFSDSPAKAHIVFDFRVNRGCLTVPSSCILGPITWFHSS